MTIKRSRKQPLTLSVTGLLILNQWGLVLDL